MTEEITYDEAFIQMYENSVKTKQLTDGELLVEVCEAFFDHEIPSWKDALLNELMVRFEAAVRHKATSRSLTCDPKESAKRSDNQNLEKTLESRLLITQFPPSRIPLVTENKKD